MAKTKPINQCRNKMAEVNIATGETETVHLFYGVALQCLYYPWNLFCKKVARSSLMRADRLRAARTLSSCFLEQHRGCHGSRSNPVALPSYLLLLYVFSCSEHLTKDNLFGCLMLRHWLVEDYMRWSSDLWWLVVGWSKCVGACEGECVCACIQWECVSVTVSLNVFMCVCVCVFSSRSSL